MSTYSVAAAKSGLPRLIDRALEGEEVIISRHGKAVAELRPILGGGNRCPTASYAWLQNRRKARKPVGLSAVELLNQLYEDPEP
jgi:antitoxin (DNA-binding transcriptional repressor) of toxin-antitoxin stability system